MRLKRVRQKRGFTQQKLSAISGVSYYMIQCYESGYKELSAAPVGTVYKLSQALGCSIDTLMGFKQLEELVINEGLKEYNIYINDGLIRAEADERLNVFIYRRFKDYKECLNLDILTQRIISQYNKSK